MNREYNLKFEEAKKMEGFKINYSMELEDMKRLFKECEEYGDSDLLSLDNCLVSMELLNSNIELIHYDVEDDGLEYGFMCCSKYEGGEWESEGFADLLINDYMFDDKDKFEELMFNSMIEFLEKEELYWSKAN